MQIRTIHSAAIGWVLVTVSIVICLSWQRAANGAEQAAQGAAPVERGQASFMQNCASCHGRDLDNGEFAPAVKGRGFLMHWGGRPVSELAAYLRANMPPGRIGELSKDDYAGLIAFIMTANGALSDATSLPADPAAPVTIRGQGEPPSEQAKLRATRLGSLSPNARIPEWPKAPNPLDHYTPVTEALLNSPPEGEWLTWRRTHNALGYSPLTQINKANVSSLHLAWSLALPVGINEMEPLVHDGVIFIFSFRDNVQALDAETGDELWHYARQLPDAITASTKRSMALFGDKLFIGTSDVHEIALDAKTGRIIWDQPIGSPEAGFALSGGPLVAKGKVMQGVGGTRADGGAYIVALDVETGKEAWRFYSIPRPGQPGGESWNGLTVEKRHGGSVWTSGSYDPELNLAFFGPGNTYDTGPLRYPSAKRGVTNDGLYTETTIALDPDTGKLKWHFQHVRNDQWDLDWAFERGILPLPINGQTKKLVVTGGKLGIFDALEASNGKYAFSVDMGLQTLISAIDPKTGAKTIDPKMLPDRDHVVTVCPHGGGGRNWMPTSYNPETKILFVAAQETCMQLTPAGTGERGFLSTGVNVTMHPRPDSDGRFGRLQAISLEQRKTLWEDRQRAFQSGGVLSTGGGVVFAAATDRWFSAYDDANGSILWRARLADIPNAPPITYSVKGKQYVAIVVGYGESAPSVFTVLTPEIPLPIARSSSIWVFALPDGISSAGQETVAEPKLVR
jgi:alcohol dehydrogenase (cytochrome c)